MSEKITTELNDGYDYSCCLQNGAVDSVEAWQKNIMEQAKTPAGYRAQMNSNWYGDDPTFKEWKSITTIPDIINHPSHYVEGRKYEPIDVIEDWKLNYHLGNALKYISRAGRKDPAKYKEDIKKAIWYLQRDL